MVVTNDKHVARMLRLYSMNGLTEANNNWDRGSVDIGHKMYMNAIQAYVAQRNLEILDRKQNILTDIMNEYNSAFKLSNTSHHLYRINLKGINQKKFIAKAAENGITAGIHYTPAHLKGVYEKHMNWFNSAERDICTYMGSSTVSIPFNEKLTDAEVKKIIAFVHENAG
jgi:dTDP-4-amino-4,6-dideoxygalactose transaminase